MNERIIKFIDRNVIRQLVRICTCLSASKQISAQSLSQFGLNQFDSILCIRPGGMGDLALMLPLLRTLKRAGKKITLIANTRNKELASLFHKYGIVDKLLLLEHLLTLLPKLRGRYDCVIDTEQSFFTSALFSYLLNAECSTGFDTNERRAMFAHLVHYSQQEYEAQSFLNLLAPLGINAKLQVDDLVFAELTKAMEQTPREKLLVFSPCAHCAERALPLHTMRAALQELAPNYTQVIAIGSTADRAHATNCALGIANFENSCGKTTIEESLQLLSRVKTFISADSGALHLALLADVPRITALFGSSVESKWALQGRIKVLSHSLPCRPCGYGRFAQTPRCPYGVPCMSQISADEIVRACLVPN